MAHWHHLLPLHLLRPMGWAVVHSVWQVTLVAGTLLAILWLLPRGAARARHLAAVSALALAVSLPIWTGVSLASATAPPVRPHDDGNGGLTIEAEHVWTHLAPAQTARESSASWSDRAAIAIDGRVDDLSLLWIAGLCLGLAQLTVGWARCALLVRRATPAPPGLVRLLDATRQRLGVRRQVALRRSEAVESPALVGWLRPTILLPAGVRPLGRSALEAALAHEVAHVRRRDYPANLVESAALRLLFFHPAAHWIARQVCAEREACCDDLAAGLCGLRDYARGMAALEAWRVGAPALGMGDTSLLARLTRLMDPRYAARRSPARAAVLLGLCCFVAGGAVAAVDASAAPTVLGGLDPVRLIAGEEVAGQAALAIEFAGHRYLFADRVSRARFVADPGRYSARNAHLCPITGQQVNPEYFRVIDGHIVLFCCDDLLPGVETMARARLAAAAPATAQ